MTVSVMGLYAIHTRESWSVEDRVSLLRREGERARCVCARISVASERKMGYALGVVEVCWRGG